MQPIIEIRNLAKRYRLGAEEPSYQSLREAFMQTLRAPFGALRRNGGSRAQTDFWALQDVNLDIYSGDTIGVIGSNGAGKSTLLKILSRITDPTAGQVKLRGRVGSLLEVGTGFHPELTGRENIYLNGSILGMRKAEIRQRFDQIVSFAGIGPFLDTPVKRYSSGMYVRLAFSIAASLDPEILIVDEVLAVGDVAFQKKCMGRMAEAGNGSRTLLFVSHNLAAVESLCKRAIVLQRGRIAFKGTSKDAVRFYMETLDEGSAGSGSHLVDLQKAAGRSVKHRPLLKRLELFHGDGRPLRGDLPAGAPVRAAIHFALDTPCVSFDASIAFDTPGGQRVCTAHSAYEPEREHLDAWGEQVFVCDVPSLPLVPGEYKVGVGLDIGGHEVDWVDDATRMTIVKSDYYGTGIIPTRGNFLLENRWRLVRQESGIECVPSLT